MATDDRLELLRRVPLFSGLGPAEIERLGELANPPASRLVRFIPY
jgi:hypothetical protein